MPTDEIVFDWISTPELAQRLANQGRALAVGAGEAAKGAPAHVVHISIVERRTVGRKFVAVSPLIPRMM